MNGVALLREALGDAACPAADVDKALWRRDELIDHLRRGGRWRGVSAVQGRHRSRRADDGWETCGGLSDMNVHA